jgi:A/G-specific adenine glycosylase
MAKLSKIKGTAPYNGKSFDAFVTMVLARGKERRRCFAWRGAADPYAILVSEIMLQQTQTARVERYFEEWMRRFPTVKDVADAPTADVLAAWAGLGYNRRALALKRAAEQVCAEFGGVLPFTEEGLLSLPGVGPATAAALLAFAYNKPAVYLETNVRSVLLHEFFPETDGVSDKELRSLLTAINERVRARGIDARDWNYALLDYGAYLKKNRANPSRRSKHHNRQSPYEGSRRQKRARLLEAVLEDSGETTDMLARALGYDPALTESILSDLAAEGFLRRDGDRWSA